LTGSIDAALTDQSHRVEGVLQCSLECGWWQGTIVSKSQVLAKKREALGIPRLSREFVLISKHTTGWMRKMLL